MISLNFDDADVFSVIQTVFGDILRVNYVVDPRIKGRVTFRSVAPIPKEQVLPVMEVILRINAIGVVEDNGLYRIVPLSDVSREPSPVSFGRDPNQIPATGKSVIQVIPIMYLQSTEVVKLIAPFLSANAVVLDVPKSNQIIVVDTDASVRRILTLIDTFDNEKQKKKRATVYVYQVQNGKAKDIANLLNQIYLGARPGMAGGTTMGSSMAPTTTAGGISGAGARPGGTPTPGGTSMTSALPTPSIAQPYGTALGQASEPLVSPITRIFSDDIINSVIVLATPEDYETIKETIAKVDITPRQVVIEGVIASIIMQDELSLGLAYSMNLKINAGNLSIGGPFGLNGSQLESLQALKGAQTGTGFTFVGTDSNGIVRAYINALATDSKAKLLAAPHILVSDNREARIQVGQQVPIITAETYGSTTVAPQRTVQYKDIGIILKVKPQINASGVVALEVSQEVSTFETLTLYSNETQIILDKTEASSNLVVQDGQTIIIGGLIREDSTRSGNGIPFLRNIPVLGYLFGSIDRKRTRTELIILLTPHVIRDQREAKAITGEYVDNITTLSTGKGGLTREEILKGGIQIRRGLGDAAGVETPYGESQQPDVVIPFGDVPLAPGKILGPADKTTPPVQPAQPLKP
jgi:general secretion pathway protein D